MSSRGMPLVLCKLQWNVNLYTSARIQEGNYSFSLHPTSMLRIFSKNGMVPDATAPELYSGCTGRGKHALSSGKC
jgi:hypothetical protein